MCSVSTNFVSLRHYKTNYGAKIKTFYKTTKSFYKEFL